MDLAGVAARVPSTAAAASLNGLQAVQERNVNV